MKSTRNRLSRKTTWKNPETPSKLLLGLNIEKPMVRDFWIISVTEPLEHPHLSNGKVDPPTFGRDDGEDRQVLTSGSKVY